MNVECVESCLCLWFFFLPCYLPNKTLKQTETEHEPEPVADSAQVSFAMWVLLLLLLLLLASKTSGK